MNGDAHHGSLSDFVSFDARFDDFDLNPLDCPVEWQLQHSGSVVSAPTSYEKNEGNEAEQRPDLNLWTPFHLRRPVLVSFVLIYAAFFATLTALFAYSERHRGLSAADNKNYYLWTYGPTTVLTIIGAFWGQAVYRVKQLAPWTSMATGFQPASKSMTLDYISSLSPVAIYQAFRNRDYITGSMLLSSVAFTVLTVSSTGLFALQQIDITARNVPLHVNNKFDFSAFDWAGMDSRPAALVYANKHLGLGYTSGTTAQYAVQNFTKSEHSLGTMSARVDAFTAWLECESIPLNVTGIRDTPWDGSNSAEVHFDLAVTSPSCTITNLTINAANGESYANISYTMGWGRAQLADCVQPNETRIHVSIGNFLVDERWNGTGLDNYTIALPPDQMFHVVNSTNILCKPGYKIEKSIVQKEIKSTSETVISSILPTGDSTNSTKNAIDIARAVFQAIYNTDDPTLDDAGYVTNSVDSFVQFLVWDGPDLDDNAFQMDETPSDSDYWLQSDNLAHQSNTLYSSVAAQMAALKLLQPTSQSVLGDFTSDSPRLMVRLLSYVIMEVCLGLLIAIASYLLVSGCHSAVSHDPGTIAGMAVVLSQSDKLVELTRHSGQLNSSDIDKVINHYTYQTSLTQVAANQYTTKIHTLGSMDSGLSRQYETNKMSDLQWWQPLVLKLVPRLLIVVVPLVCLAVLQVLLVESMSRNGLCNVSSNGWTHYGWTYVPALLMVCIRVTYNAVNFSIQTLSPYSIMRRAPATASISVEDQPLSRIALHELFVSLRRRQLSTFASTAGAFLAPLLTIAVSGLYNLENGVRDVKVQQVTGWHFNDGEYPNSTLVGNIFQTLKEPSPFEDTWSDSSGAANADLIVMANLSYPSWTYDELAFSVLEVSSLEGNDEVASQPADGSLQARIPAIRGGLNCSILTDDKINITYTTNSMSLSYTDPWNTVWVLGTAGSRQGQSKLVQSESLVDVATTPSDILLAFVSTTDGDSLKGCPLAPQIVFLPISSGSQQFGYFSPLDFHENDTSTNCPVYGGMFGTFNENILESFTWFFCSTYAEQVMVETTFVLPDYNISTAYADETTAAHVATNATHPLGMGVGGAGGIVSLPPVISSGVNLLPAVDVNGFVSFYNTSDGQNYDNFFSALIYGRDGVSAESISGRDNTHRLLSAIQHLWRVIYTQHIRSIPLYWSAAPDDIKAFAPTGEWTGTFKSTSQYRLKQSIVSTRLLQAVLGVLSCCAVVTFLSMDTRKVLPNNPSSIAVMASLLAGSEMLNETASRPSRGDRSSLWQGYLFSLGWWDLPDGGKRFGIDVRKADKGD